jgi:hypothetical protein
MSDAVHNERVKLTANVLNAAAAGMFVTGVVAPAVAVLYGIPGPSSAGLGLIAVASAAWFAASLTIHSIARRILGRLR